MRLMNTFKLGALFVIILFIEFVLAELSVWIISENGQVFFDQSIINSTFTLYNLSFWINAILLTILSTYLYSLKQSNNLTLQSQLIKNDRCEGIETTAFKELGLSQADQEFLHEEQQEQLEQMVQERTLELNIALQELESANRELAKITTIDELSGLYNRRFYDQKILAEHRRSRRNLTSLSLVIVDIDHFKSVNDTYGHLAGDYCIVWLAEKIKHCLGRSSDIGCRYGGEEFCLILPETDRQGAISLAEEVRLAVSADVIHYQELKLSMTISCGISTYQQQKGILPEHLFSAADEALYLAKNSGRNQVQHKDLLETINSKEQLI